MKMILKCRFRPWLKLCNTNNLTNLHQHFFNLWMMKVFEFHLLNFFCIYLLFIQQLLLNPFSAVLTRTLFSLFVWRQHSWSLSFSTVSPSLSLFLPDFITVMIFLSRTAKCLEIIKLQKYLFPFKF